jgi:cysteine synthase
MQEFIKSSEFLFKLPLPPQSFLQLAAKEGIFGGSSYGATLAAAEKLAASGAKGNIVLVFADRAERYFSKKILA